MTRARFERATPSFGRRSRKDRRRQRRPFRNTKSLCVDLQTSGCANLLHPWALTRRENEPFQAISEPTPATLPPKDMTSSGERAEQRRLWLPIQGGRSSISDYGVCLGHPLSSHEAKPRSPQGLPPVDDSRPRGTQAHRQDFRTNQGSPTSAPTYPVPSAEWFWAAREPRLSEFRRPLREERCNEVQDSFLEIHRDLGLPNAQATEWIQL